MIAAALPGATALAQALMGGDASIAADPAAGTAGADFAAMMAGLGTSAPPPVDDAADAAPAEDATRGKDPRDDGDAPPQDAALLAMLALMPQAAPQAAESPPRAADVQAPATISPAARSAAATIAAAPTAGQAADVAIADAAPKTMASKTPAAPRPKLPAIDPDPAPADIVAVAAAILGQGRPAGPKAAKPADPAAGAMPPLAPAQQPADAAVIAALVHALPGDPPRAAHVTAAPDGTLGAALGEQRLSLAQGSGWLDQLARDIASTVGVEGKLHFRLNPEHLGSLHVEVTRGAEGAAVRLTADTQDARDILVDAQPRLVAEARAQGVRIAGTHVDLGSQSAPGGGRRQPQGLSPQVRAIGAAAATDTTEPRGAASERYA